MEEEWIAGKHSVTEALRSGRTINKIWIADTAQKHLTQPIIAEAKKQGIVIQHVDKRKLDQTVPGIQHQGVVAQAALQRGPTRATLRALVPPMRRPT